ncbi:MAG: DpnI domain-containing protein [Clostridia bacterium]|nr:DpnI domain-containing protein [Clostridia bacterium]
MNLNFNLGISSNYHSNTQIARVLTENWVKENMFCPVCGRAFIERFPNNAPVADFYCPDCKHQYELKSKNGPLGNKVNDGAYDAMIKRITSNENPDFFLMNYSKETWSVRDFVFVPRFFFTPGIIEKRKPLGDTALRAGWTGCNILINQIPRQGRIQIISDGIAAEPQTVVGMVSRSLKLEVNDLSTRGWLFDILNCVNAIRMNVFRLEDVYTFEEWLHSRHPRNNNIKPKIRQQLQLLRDKGYIEFLGNGLYRKL